MMGEGTLLENINIDDQRILPIIRSVNAGKLSDIDIVRPDISDSARLHALDIGMKKYRSGAVCDPLSQYAIGYGKGDFSIDDNTLQNSRFELHNNEIAAIIPAYNEEVSIGSMVLHAKKYAGRIIVVDDGSSDSTAEVAEMAGAEVVCHPRNMGKGAALRTGFKTALQNDTKIIITMDADGQHNPAEIPKLLEPIRSGEADMVNGSRYVGGNGRNTPAYRRIGQTVLDRATNLNSGIKITDSQSGFRAFAAHTLPYFRFKQNGFSIESEMLADAANAKLKVKEVEIGVRYDVDCCSTEHPVRHGILVLLKVLQDMEFNKPLYYFTVPGMVTVSVGVLMGLMFLREFYLGGSLMFGPTLLMILLMLVGIFMTFTGIILHSMSRLIKESKMNLG
jgi:glycosyltransferase involved in cell wall biosynthesis